MKRSINISLLILISISLITCIAHNDNNVTNIKMTDNIINHIYSDDLIEVEKFIPLETDTTFLIGEIGKIVVYDEMLFILDNTIAKKLFVFDMNGKFIRTIGKLGKGADELLNPVDFSINLSNGNIAILDNYRSLLVFKINGEMKYNRILSKENRFDNICYNNNDLYLYTSNCSGTKDGYSIHIFDEKFNEKKILKYDESCDFIHPIKFPMYQVKNKFYYLDMFKACLYEFKDQSVVRKLQMDFEDKYMPSNILNKAELFFKEFKNYCFLREYVQGDDNAYFQILNRSKYNFAVLDMKNNKISVYSNIEDRKVPFIPPSCFHNSEFYSIIYPSNIIDKTELLNQINSDQKISLLDNPIVYTYKFK